MNVAVLLPLGRDPERNFACLESLGRTLPARWRGEIVLIANPHAETPADRRGTLPSEVRCRVLPAPTTLRAAAATVSAPILCLVDPGTVFLPGWLPPMRRALHAADCAGCVGNVQREPYSGLIEHAGIGFDANGLPLAVGRGSALLPPDRFDRRAAVSMACGLVRREVFERLGGFDPCFDGRLRDVDFCLRAATVGLRHYVANRSVVYHFDDPAGSPADDPGLPLYRERWGDRARACHQRRAGLRRRPPGASFTPEHWEMARESRRLLRLEIHEVRGKGRRYLAKHWFRPWRYNGHRVARALAQAWQPLPTSLLPLPPGYPADTARPDDGWLFDPPPQP